MLTRTFLRDLYDLWFYKSTILNTPSGTNDLKGNPQAAPVSTDNPLPVTLVGGGSGGTTISFPTITATYSPQSLQVGNSQAQLTIPAGATDATLLVISGSVRRSIGGNASASTPILNAGDSESISGAELAAYRMTREGSSDAQISVEYRKVS